MHIISQWAFDVRCMCDNKPTIPWYLLLFRLLLPCGWQKHICVLCARRSLCLFYIICNNVLVHTCLCACVVVVGNKTYRQIISVIHTHSDTDAHTGDVRTETNDRNEIKERKKKTEKKTDITHHLCMRSENSPTIAVNWCKNDLNLHPSNLSFLQFELYSRTLKKKTIVFFILRSKAPEIPGD